MPFLAEFTLCDAFGWTEGDCRAASPIFKEAMLMILEARSTHRKLVEQRIAAQTAKG